MPRNKRVCDIVESLPKMSDDPEFWEEPERLDQLLANYELVVWPRNRGIDTDSTMINFIYWLMSELDLIENVDWAWLFDPEEGDVAQTQIVLDEDDAHDLDRLVAFIASQLGY